MKCAKCNKKTDYLWALTIAGEQFMLCSDCYDKEIEVL